jgi:carbon storage regulator CsrA
MLVLSRKSGQKIEIGSNVVITVVAVKGKRITIGIDAPQDIRIRRSESSDHAALVRVAEIAADNCDPLKDLSLSDCKDLGA